IKIILTIAQLLSAESQIETNRQWNEAITNVQEQKTWIKEDIVNGRISEEEAQYYLDNLNETEDLLIKLYNEKD
ncbi:MAG: hypothetical protein HRT86_09645, partial [Ilumatobacteraceae bacterium]|nr:hypothetical protein [Ilumatobacteraceae bacterium]